jgi:AraC-like DNA-binding protein
MPPTEEDVTVYWVTRERAEERIVWAKASAKPFHVVFTCLTGRIEVPLAARRLRVTAGRTLVFRADRLSGPVVALELPAEIRWASFYASGADRIPLAPTATDPGELDLLFQRLLAAFARMGAHSDATTFWMRAILRVLAEDHAPADARDSARAADIVGCSIQQIDAHPERFWSVADLARRAGFSATHFSRTFRRLTGRPPQQYLIDARTSRARTLLRETDLPVTRIAHLLGYQDVYHFSRQFRRRTGLTPSDARRLDHLANPSGRPRPAR